MLFKPLALAATAAAFLLVPEASDTAKRVAKALPVPPAGLSIPPTALSQSLTVPCRQCKHKNSQLQLDLEVVDGSKLQLNGFELYPHADPWNGDLTAVVIKDDGEEKKQRLGYSLAILPGPTDEDLQMQLITIELRVIEVGSRFVNDIPIVRVQLVKAEETKEIVIGNISFKETPQSCRRMWCRARQSVSAILKSIRKGKGCGGIRGHGHRKPDFSRAEADKQMAEHFRQQRHGWCRFIKDLAAHIVLPVLMGITAGVGVALFAMLVCSVTVRLTRTVLRSRAGARFCPKMQNLSMERKADCEKLGLMEDGEAAHEEPPPRYRDDDSSSGAEAHTKVV
ncbi:hypothetical protein RJ55_06121 [Drechmeria coniospora]|nr:hypothetical protein RJ55_06121 [Drechmeria coniospora]